MATHAPGVTADRVVGGAHESTTGPGGSSSQGTHHHMAVGACKRLWGFHYYAGIRVQDDRPCRRRGTCFHTHGAYHYAARLQHKPRWFSVPLAEALEYDARGNKKVIEDSWKLWEAYRLKYSSDSIEPFAVEEEYWATLEELAPSSLKGDPLLARYGKEIITSRVDLLGWTNGWLWVTDHKTTSADYRTQRLPTYNDDGEFRLSLQGMTNLHVTRAHFRRERTDGLHEKIRGFSFNRVRSVQPYDFDRNVMRIHPLAYEEVALNLLDMADQRARTLERMQAGLPVPPNFGACFGRWGACDYAEVCAADTPESRQGMLELLYEQTL